MVVCKCKKATKLYCFVHKVPVCGECICFPEHQICVVRTYSEWVLDGEYDQPKCCQCQATFDEGEGHQVTRLGCLRYSKTVIGRCFNPRVQEMKSLLHMMPRIWGLEGSVLKNGTDCTMSGVKIDRSYLKVDWVI